MEISQVSNYKISITFHKISITFLIFRLFSGMLRGNFITADFVASENIYSFA